MSANTVRSGARMQPVNALKILIGSKMTAHNKLQNAQGATIAQNQAQKKLMLLQK